MRGLGECRGPGLELAPLAGIFASSVPPDFRPLPRRAAERAFALQPGKTTLDPVRNPQHPHPPPTHHLRFIAATQPVAG